MSDQKLTFADGYKIGFHLVNGTNTAISACPPSPPIPANSTPYLEGIKAGIRWAGGELTTR